MTKNCSRCAAAFECSVEQQQCWCMGLVIDPKTLKMLRENYDNCLCPNCLSDYSLKALKN